MHEATLMTGLMRKIDELARRQDATRIVGVSVWLGALSHMSADHFRDHFAQAAAGTIAEGAKLKIVASDDIADANAANVLLNEIQVES